MSGVAVNPIIYAELVPAFASEAELLTQFSELRIQLLPLPCSCAWLAADAYRQYRRRGGTRQSILPDFFIGAHPQAEGFRVITRDLGRFRTYFPSVSLYLL